MPLGRSCIIVVQSLSCVQLFATPWTAAHQASLSLTVSWSLFRLLSAESMMPSSHHILGRPLLLLPSIFPSIKVFSNELVLCTTWPEYWSFSFSISPSNEYSGLISLICMCVCVYVCIYIFTYICILYIYACMYIWKSLNFFIQNQRFYTYWLTFLTKIVAIYKFDYL